MKQLYSILLILCFGLFTQLNAIDTPEIDANITGKVCEKVQGELIAIPFANVVCKGTTVGTFAGIEGNFELDLDKGKHTIIVSCVGYKPITKTIKVRKNKTIELFNIQLQPTTTQTAYKD